MANMNSTDGKRSRYVQGGTTERYSTRLGWWERQILEKNTTDVAVTITSKYALRPDLLAAEFYGDSRLQWLVLQFNNIVDINIEFVEGKEILLPSPSRVTFGMLNNSTGGVPPTTK